MYIRISPIYIYAKILDIDALNRDCGRSLSGLGTYIRFKIAQWTLYPGPALCPGPPLYPGPWGTGRAALLSGRA